MIVKQCRDVAYEMMPREVLQGVRDAFALGVWVYLSSRPEDWHVSMTELRDHFCCGRDKMLGAFKVLRAAGLMTTESLQGDDGKLLGKQVTIHRHPLKPTADGGLAPMSENPTMGETPTYRIQSLTEDRKITEDPSMSPKGDDAPRVSPDDVVELYNDSLGDELGRVIKLTAQRRRQVQARIQKDDLAPFDDLETWRHYFARVEESDFLMGRNRVNGARPWRASFDWLITERATTRVAEGKYQNE